MRRAETHLTVARNASVYLPEKLRVLLHHIRAGCVEQPDVTEPYVPFPRAAHEAVDCLVFVHGPQLGFADTVDTHVLALQLMPEPLIASLLSKLDLAVVDPGFS